MKSKQITKYCLVCKTPFITGGRAGDISKQFCSTECRRKGRYRKGKVAKYINPLDAAYLAGFVDGEGTVMITSRSNIVTTCLSISNTYRAVLEWILETTGVGSIIQQRSQSNKHSASYFWRISGDSALSVLEQIRDYLKIKQRQADLAIDVQKKLKNPALKCQHEWQAEVRLQMKTMNLRGQKV